jgi:glycosyltransferase involved in cell wall biosynthesis
MCARNEEIHIRSALKDLIGEGLEVILIDHDSTDRTVPIAREFLGRGLLDIERLPWANRFSLAEQLQAKWRVIDQLDHDWFVHVDADEWLSAPDPGQPLIEGLRAADAAGYNCVNFNEFVFLPEPGCDLSESENYRRQLTRYYLHEPYHPYLLRAWKNRAGLENRGYSRHLLSGNTRRYPRDFPLRHYIFLSEVQARRKYLTRAYDGREVANGWHDDRLRATAENLRFPSDERLFVLPHWSSKQFDTSRPFTEQFWEWTIAGSPYAARAAPARLPIFESVASAD